MSLDAPALAAREPLADRLRTSPLNFPILGLVLLHHTMALLAFTQPFRLAYLPLMAGLYTWGALSTTLYMHRHLAHRGFELAYPLQVLGALGTTLGLAGDPVIWVGIHRHHHGHADLPDDPHSPLRGFLLGHFAWALRVTPAMADEFRALAPDVRRDRLCRWLENPAIYSGCHVAVGALVYAGWGLGGLLWGYYFTLVLLLHATYAVNSVCHLTRFGSRRFDTRDESRNVAWLALPTLGESFHNNHHNNPRRAEHGLAWYELDLTKVAIWSLERLGLARKVAWNQTDIESQPSVPRT